MPQILIPTTSAEDWKRLLAKPELHWKEGFSAMTLAQSWEAARKTGFPPEIEAMLGTSGNSAWKSMRLLVAIPEFQVPLPGGSRPSQTDLLALARADDGLVVVAVEGKVDETLGPTVGEKRADNSAGVNERLAYLQSVLGLPECEDHIRYQLLHRVASALIVAHDFNAKAAVMLVHAFGTDNTSFADFQAFAKLFQREARIGQLIDLGVRHEKPLYIGWCAGDQKFRKLTSIPA